MFWRKKPAKPETVALEPSTDYVAEVSSDVQHSLQTREDEIVEELDQTPTPKHTLMADAAEAEDLRDHSADGGWLSRLVGGLTKSTDKLGQGIADIFTKKKVDKHTLAELEDVLIAADLGPKTAAKIVAKLAETKIDKEADETEIKQELAAIITSLLQPVQKPLALPASANPAVFLVTGVNGVGKTTTIGKLAEQFRAQGHKIVLGAADTFRAAAVEQLQIWGKRAHAHVVVRDIGADPAAVAFETIAEAKKEKADVVLIDTAGRLHNKANLMAELDKIVRVIKKHDKTAPHETLLVLDATTGQNALEQAKAFGDVAKLTGLVITKLDGSAKGGVVVALADTMQLPILAVGVGEQIDDLQPFNAEAFAKALVGLG